MFTPADGTQVCEPASLQGGQACVTMSVSCAHESALSVPRRGQLCPGRAFPCWCICSIGSTWLLSHPVSFLLTFRI